MSRRLPVTLIGGFLGAGKTSLLHYFITEHQGGDLAILVESPGALNPDARALRGLCGAMGRTHHTVAEIVPDDERTRAAQLRDLAQSGRYERVLIEVAGTTDAARLIRDLEAGAEVEQVVCVVDLLAFYRSFVAPGSSPDALGGFQREQVEGASLIVLNKCDLAADSERHSSTRLLRQLNAEAPIIETAYGEVPPEIILRPARTEILDRTRWRKRLEEEPPPSLESVIYRAHRPFHPERLWNWFNAPHAGLLRVKGLVWLATRHLLVGGISRTLWQNSCGAAGIWWAALPREEWPTDVQRLEQMQADWREPYGDRRQELMLIGQSGVAGNAARQLNGCLLTSEEYARPPAAWAQWPDPFPAWDLKDES